MFWPAFFLLWFLQWFLQRSLAVSQGNFTWISFRSCPKLPCSFYTIWLVLLSPSDNRISFIFLMTFSYPLCPCAFRLCSYSLIFPAFSDGQELQQLSCVFLLPIRNWIVVIDWLKMHGWPCKWACLIPVPSWPLSFNPPLLILACFLSCSTPLLIFFSFSTSQLSMSEENKLFP